MRDRASTPTERTSRYAPKQLQQTAMYQTIQQFIPKQTILTRAYDLTARAHGLVARVLDLFRSAEEPMIPLVIPVREPTNSDTDAQAVPVPQTPAPSPQTAFQSSGPITLETAIDLYYNSNTPVYHIIASSTVSQEELYREIRTSNRLSRREARPWDIAGRAMNAQAMRKQGTSVRDIANLWGVSTSTIYRDLKRELPEQLYETIPTAKPQLELVA